MFTGTRQPGRNLPMLRTQNIDGENGGFRIDTSGASEIAGRYDGAGDAIAQGGMLRPNIWPARLTPFLDMNDDAQLARFGLHNGAPNNSKNLCEKWESLALAPGGDFLLVGSDNDFITQNGMMAGKPYADASGADVDTLVLAYRVSLSTARGSISHPKNGGLGHH